MNKENKRRKYRKSDKIKAEILETIEKEEFTTPTDLRRILKIDYYKLKEILSELKKEKKIEAKMRGKHEFLRIK